MNPRTSERDAAGSDAPYRPVGHPHKPGPLRHGPVRRPEKPVGKAPPAALTSPSPLAGEGARGARPDEGFGRRLRFLGRSAPIIRHCLGAYEYPADEHRQKRPPRRQSFPKGCQSWRPWGRSLTEKANCIFQIAEYSFFLSTVLKPPAVYRQFLYESGHWVAFQGRSTQPNLF